MVFADSLKISENVVVEVYRMISFYANEFVDKKRASGINRLLFLIQKNLDSFLLAFEGSYIFKFKSTFSNSYIINKLVFHIWSNWY